MVQTDPPVISEVTVATAVKLQSSVAYAFYNDRGSDFPIKLLVYS